MRLFQIWQLDLSEAICSLEGHEKGVNTVSYCVNGLKPFIVSGSDDHSVKVWDNQVRDIDNGTDSFLLIEF